MTSRFDHPSPILCVAHRRGSSRRKHDWVATSASLPAQWTSSCLRLAADLVRVHHIPAGQPYSPLRTRSAARCWPSSPSITAGAAVCVMVAYPDSHPIYRPTYLLSCGWISCPPDTRSVGGSWQRDTNCQTLRPAVTGYLTLYPWPDGVLLPPRSLRSERVAGRQGDRSPQRPAPGSCTALASRRPLSAAFAPAGPIHQQMGLHVDIRCGHRCALAPSR